MSEDEYTTTFIHEEREERFKIRFIPEVECGTNRWIRLNNGVPILSNTANIFTLIDPSTNEPVNILLILSHKESVHKQTRHTKIVKQIQEIQDSKNPTDDQKVNSALHEENEQLREEIKLHKSQIDELGKTLHEVILELPETHHETIMNKLQNSKIIQTIEFLKLTDARTIEQNQKIVDEIIKVYKKPDQHLVNERGRHLLYSIVHQSTGKDIKDL